MWRRFKKVALPVLIALLLAVVLFAVAAAKLRAEYQTANNAKLASLIGVIREQYPELDELELVAALRGQGDDLASLTRGQEFFQRFGYQADENFSAEAEQFALRLSQNAIMIFALLVGGLGCYFWWRDSRLSNEIEQLIHYLDDLSNRLYDLRPQDNREGEFSRFRNELYKITVVLQEAAAENQRSRQNLETALADISHQLRTPLTSLAVTINNIYGDPTMPEKTRQDFLRSASRQVESMSNLVTTLLNLAKFDNKTIKMHPQSMRVDTLLSQVREHLEVLADLHDIEIQLSGDLAAEVALDPRWELEALSNILKNAIERSPPGTAVELRAIDCPLFLKLEIEDHGEGIPRHDLRRIFERFYKSQNASPESVGIGLAFAKAIIEADNGQITVRSEEGSGAKFTITYFKNKF